MLVGALITRDFSKKKIIMVGLLIYFLLPSLTFILNTKTKNGTEISATSSQSTLRETLAPIAVILLLVLLTQTSNSLYVEFNLNLSPNSFFHFIIVLSSAISFSNLLISFVNLLSSFLQ